MFMSLGGENVLIPNPRDIPGFVKELGKFKFTAITGVNTLFNALLNNPDFAKLDFSPLRITLGGGMAVQQAVAEKWKKVTGNAADRGLRPDRDLARGDDQSAGPAPTSTARSACRSPRPSSTLRDDDGKDGRRWASRARSASAARR